MLRLFKFRKDINPFIYLPRSARIKGDELFLVESATCGYVVIDDNNGNGRKYGVPLSAGKVTRLEISL